ncbi:multiple sugar transport system permease protein [Anaerotaenia torta]|uniref:carbohydrate ABC transporter permease n=1 Tax=Anaerotaenia torta TaxID=433293 RepID=UPI003D25E924
MILKIIRQGNACRGVRHLRGGVRHRLGRRETGTAWLFLLPSLLGIAVFVLLPFLDAVRRSFFEAMGGRFVGLKNYRTVLENEAFRLAAGNTGRFILVCIPLLLLLSLLLSVMMQHRGDFFKVSFLIPMAVPVASVALLWKIFFHNQGLLNHLLVRLGSRPVDWMNTDYAFLVLVFSYVWKNAGYDCVLWLSGLGSISETVYEAAAIDGAGVLGKFFYITLPGLLPTLFVAAVMSLVNSFKVFREAYLVAGAYPQSSIYMLQHLLNNWFVSLDIQKMCAAASMLAAVFILFLLLLHGLGRRGVEE